MKLYYSRGTCALGPHIVLHEIGVPFTVEAVDNKTKKTASGADYLQINPKGYVPALELDDGAVLTEAAIILQYLADLKPAAGLLAPSGMTRYRTLEWVHFVSTEVHKTISPFFAADTPEEYKTILRGKLQQRLSFIEQTLSRSEYLMGAHWTIPDVYFFVTTNWFRVTGIDLATFPGISEFKQRVSARPAVQAAMRTEGLLK
jgi:glutathione S-transferase